MELINPMGFASAVLVAEEQFAAISKLLRKYCGNEPAECFIRAYNSNDVGISIDMLDQLVLAISGCSNTTDALYQFIEKFPNLNPELYGAVAAESFEFRKITALDQFYEAMKRTMEGG